MLGRGAFGKVNLALHKLTRRLCAIKSINKKYLSDEKQRGKFEVEVNILKKMRHMNVVRLLETFETDKYFLIVMELCCGGDLLTYVRKRRRLAEPLAKYLFKQIVEGVGHVHSKHIIHRDIKLDNILLDAQGHIKIGDFGVSKELKAGEKIYESCGTPAYIAPEVLTEHGYEGNSVDLWSLGGKFQKF